MEGQYDSERVHTAQAIEVAVRGGVGCNECGLWVEPRVEGGQLISLISSLGTASADKILSYLSIYLSIYLSYLYLILSLPQRDDLRGIPPVP